MADSRLRCGVNFHPSLRLEGFYGGDTKSLAESNKIPQLLFPCKDDPDNVKPGDQCELPETLSTIHPLDEVTHGFSSQGDIGDPVVKRNCEKVFDMAVTFMRQHQANKL